MNITIRLHQLKLQIPPPQLDLQIYQNIPEAQQLLNQALGQNWDQLKLQVETDIQRTSRLMSVGDTDIEISLDVGHIRCADAEVEVHEVEFELKQGSIQQLLAFSFEWVKKFHLWLDVRNKAEIGHLLSVKQKVSPAAQSKEFQFSKKDHADQNLRLLIAQQLQHLLPNIAAISAQVAEQSHLDQAQLALQHLQLTLCLFKDWSKQLGDKWAMQIAAFKQHFDHLQHLEHMQATLGAFLQNPTTAENLKKDTLCTPKKNWSI